MTGNFQTLFGVSLVGSGSATPAQKITNDQLAARVDTNDEWVNTRTGIRERRIIGSDESLSNLSTRAAISAIEMAGWEADTVDMVLVATSTPDDLFGIAPKIQAQLGATNAVAFDLTAACSGFLFALVTAAQYLQNGTFRRVIVIGADQLSSWMDWDDRSSCVLFGDGAGAVLLEPSGQPGIVDSILKIDGSGGDYLKMIAGGSLNPASLETVKHKQHYAYQDGKTVFKFAVTKMADVSEHIMQRNNLSGDDVDWLVPHQANLRIIDATAKRMQIEPSKVMINIQKYGNTTAATIPLCLAEWEQKLKNGDNLILASFGGGFTWGAIYLIWRK